MSKINNAFKVGDLVFSLVVLHDEIQIREYKITKVMPRKQEKEDKTTFYFSYQVVDLKGESKEIPECDLYDVYFLAQEAADDIFNIRESGMPRCVTMEDTLKDLKRLIRPTKFNIGDEVFFFMKNDADYHISSVLVSSINRVIEDNGIHFMNTRHECKVSLIYLTQDGLNFREDDIYATRDEVMKVITIKLEQDIKILQQKLRYSENYLVYHNKR